MESKTFHVVTSISMVMALTAAALSLIGIIVTGLYPGIAVLLLLALIPIASRYFAKKIASSSAALQVNYYAAAILINLILIFVVLWMSFVIVHDRFLRDCC